MKVQREELLSTLKVAAVGAALPPRMVTIEQADCFVFRNGWLNCYNDEVATRTRSPLGDLECAVHAGDLLKLLGKFPDREVDLELKKGALVVRGKRRDSGIKVQQEILLPYRKVPKPGGWSPIPSGVGNLLKQAGWTCGKDMTNVHTTVVHVTPKVVEACDNFRLFRAKAKTGFPEEVLVPAFALEGLESIPLRRVSVTKGDAKAGTWCHFRTAKEGGTVVSVRCVPSEYVDLGKALAIEGEELVKLPENLAEVVERSEVMSEGVDPIVKVSIEDGELSLRAEKEGGWYRERKKVSYKGRPLRFAVNPKFLVEVLQRTTTVKIGATKLKLEAEGVEFVVVLEAQEEPAKETPKAPTKRKKEKAAK